MRDTRISLASQGMFVMRNKLRGNDISITFSTPPNKDIQISICFTQKYLAKSGYNVGKEEEQRC